VCAGERVRREDGGGSGAALGTERSEALRLITTTNPPPARTAAATGASGVGAGPLGVRTNAWRLATASTWALSRTVNA